MKREKNYLIFPEGEAFQDVKFSPSGNKLAFTGSIVGGSSRDASLDTGFGNNEVE